MPKVAAIPPNTPAVLYPICSCIYLTIGPGVGFSYSYHVNKLLRSYPTIFINKFLQKGKVARPPPIENKPILRNSKKSRTYTHIIFILSPFFKDFS